jgi:TRAP-type mannitol/chloroaromatic compound transport system permease small subunit
MRRLLAIIDSLCTWTGKAASWLTFLVVIFIVYEIMMRYVFHLPTLWVSESMVFGCGLTYVLGAAWALQDNRHVKIDLIYGRLSFRQRAVIDSVTFVFFALYLGFFCGRYPGMPGSLSQLLKHPDRPGIRLSIL